MPTRTLATAVALMCSVLAAPARGQDLGDGPDAPAGGAVEQPGVSFQLTLGSAYSIAAEYDDAGGELSVLRAGGRFDARFTTSETSRLSMTFGAEHSWYEFDGPVTLAPGTTEPFEHAAIYDVGATFSARASERWTWLVGGSVESAAESGADFAESLTYGGMGGVQHHVSDSLSLGLAVVVSSRLEDDVRVVPVPLIEWRIDERWRLGSWVLGQKAGAYALTYKASEAFTFGVAAAYDSREFRLDEDGPVPDGVGRDRRVPVAFVGEWTPDRRVSVRGFVGADAFSETEVLDLTGATLGEDSTDPAFTFGVAAVLRF